MLWYSNTMNLPKDKVACVFKQDKDGKTMNHTGMHIGEGKIIHCSAGVQTGKVTQRGWTHFAIPVGLYDSSSRPWPACRRRSEVRLTATLP